VWDWRCKHYREHECNTEDDDSLTHFILHRGGLGGWELRISQVKVPQNIRSSVSISGSPKPGKPLSWMNISSVQGNARPRNVRTLRVAQICFKFSMVGYRFQGVERISDSYSPKMIFGSVSESKWVSPLVSHSLKATFRSLETKFSFGYSSAKTAGNTGEGKQRLSQNCRIDDTVTYPRH